MAKSKNSESGNSKKTTASKRTLNNFDSKPNNNSRSRDFVPF